MNSQGCLRLRAATAARGLAALLVRSAPPPLATPSSGHSLRLRGAGLRSRATACKGRAAFGRGDPRPRSALSGVAPPRWALRSPAGPRSSLFVRTLRAALPACSQGARARWACPAAGPPPLCRAASPFLTRKNCDSGARRGLAPAAPLAPSQRSVAVAPPWAQRAVARVSRSPFGRVRPRPQGPRAPFLPRPRYAGER